jgi:iron complex outermembrane receptor protein
LPAHAQSTVEIPQIIVNAPPSDLTTPPLKERFQLPQTTASTTAATIEQTVNIVDSEDAVKYLPSVLLRKRNYGDNQVVLATRTWGINSSARSLVYLDDILLSALLGNTNSNQTTRWGQINPEVVDRIDVLYGPFAAMYPGNSIGGVMQVTTRMPDKPLATIKQTGAFQTFDYYKTKGTYGTSETSASFGNRWNALSALINVNYQDSNSQPLGFVTSTSTPAGTTGTIPALSRTGTVANVLGAGGLLHTQQATVNGKFALDLTDWLTATYTIGYWSNEQHSNVDTYLRDAAGNPTYGGQSGFASNYYSWNERHLTNSLAFKTDTHEKFDWEITASRYDYLADNQRNPFTVTPTGVGFSPNGKIASLTGTNWSNADAKGIWRPTGPGGQHEVSFGMHFDRYELDNPTYATPTWNGGPDTTSSLYSNGRGKTQTAALWAQDAWKFAPQFKLTLGGRWESWRAFDGFNLTTTTNSAGAILTTSSVTQPELSATRFSPKASLAWDPTPDWNVTGSVGIASRFPTVGELYQTATVGTALINPNPNLKPEKAVSEELAITRKFHDGMVRFSLFQENAYDALVSQNTTIAGTTTTTSFVSNVDSIRNRGVELAWKKNNILIDRLEAFGSVTYVDSVILSDPTFVGTGGSTATGKQVPYVPRWRVTSGFTYRPTDAWAFTLAGRYQSKIYGTLDNTDCVANVYQSFNPFFVVDVRALYKVSEHGSISVGIDNLNNEKYFLFHPFPQRTFVVQGKLTY